MRLAPLVLLVLGLCGCAVAPHGSKATHRVWTYQGRQDGLVRYEVVTDRSAGRGFVILMDPKVQSGVLSHTNSMLQTGGVVTVGDGSVVVDPQTGAIIGAMGTAVGNVVGAAVKKAVIPGLP